MSDIFSSEKRSEIMSKITGKETKPEIIVRKFLFSCGLRYRKNVKELPGKPDIVLPKYRTVIFVNGCFWHGHSCNAAGLPRTNPEFWREKIAQNQRRDNQNIYKLKLAGWQVRIVWSCELKNKQLQKQTLDALLSAIAGHN